MHMSLPMKTRQIMPRPYSVEVSTAVYVGVPITFDFATILCEAGPLGLPLGVSAPRI